MRDLKMKVLVSGSLAYDYIMNFDGRFADHILPEKIHKINLSFMVKTLHREYGGCAGNIAYNLALLGLKPKIFGTVGGDSKNYLQWLAANGVNVDGVKIIKQERTASAYILTDRDDNQITGFYSGAASCLYKGSPCSLARAALFVIIAPHEPKTMMAWVRWCQKNKVDYMFDPGMQLPVLSDREVILGVRGAKIVIGNDYEIASLKSKIKKSKLKMTIKNSKILKNESEQIWIMTLGAEGSVIKPKTNHELSGIYSENQKSKIIRIPAAKPKNTNDPTGAGDAYRAGFLAGYLRGLALEVCGKMGSTAAVYTVEKYGTQTHKFSIKEFCQRYKENFGERLNIQ